MFQYIFKTWEQALPDAYPIRYEVFVIEQQISVNLEIDEHDARAQHLILWHNNKAIGTSRIFLDTTTSQRSFKIGRLAILKKYRGKGLGKDMISHLLTYAAENASATVTLDAQIKVVPFYEKLGFTAAPNTFFEDGILHKKCTILLNEHFSIKQYY